MNKECPHNYIDLGLDNAGRPLSVCEKCAERDRSNLVEIKKLTVEMIKELYYNHTKCYFIEDSIYLSTHNRIAIILN